MAEIEYSGIKIGGSKLLLIVPLLGTIIGGLWGGFELYSRYLDMEEKIQKSRFNKWQNSLPQPYRFIFKTSMFVVCMYLIEMWFNLVGMSMLPWRWEW